MGIFIIDLVYQGIQKLCHFKLIQSTVPPQYRVKMRFQFIISRVLHNTKFCENITTIKKVI